MRQSPHFGTRSDRRYNYSAVTGLAIEMQIAIA